ncbi:hypothetical protein B0T25DRAFT_569367 [Lasiosphaeria hispida]|uniref:Uncharacterized protein n=1 Tax=Lasiosphaeria hispida TaxID=260671 RepID=A0AAJ0HDB3_9PEZI|nr:hypothetical protein B0T25DRAFT_569367 [Lasiosphaeria hispida]
MAQLTASSTLTSAPSIVGQLVIEPPIADEQGPVVNSMFFGIPDLGEIVNAGVGAVSGAVPEAITGQNLADIIAGLIPSIAEIVQAARAGTVAVPLDQIARLAVDSPQFYCVVGAIAAAATPAAPPHVVATQAQGAQRDFPSLWYVNFPHIMSEHDVEAVRRNRKSMTDFRSWPSKKWWEEVGRRFGVADEAIQRASQSKQFAEIACEDMVKMSCIECDSHQLHRMLLGKIMNGWSTVDGDLVETVEPIFQGIVKAALGGSREFSQMKNIVMEKYVYAESTKSITSCAGWRKIYAFSPSSCTRLFTTSSAAKGRRGSRVSVELSLCLYEAVFEAALWEQFSATLHEKTRQTYFWITSTARLTPIASIAAARLLTRSSYEATQTQPPVIRGAKVSAMLTSNVYEENWNSP